MQILEDVCMYFFKMNVKYEIIDKVPVYYEHSASGYSPFAAKGGESHLLNKTHGEEIWTNLSNKNSY